MKVQSATENSADSPILSSYRTHQHTAQAVYTYIQGIQKHSVGNKKSTIFVDVDGTLINPLSPHANAIIEDVKAHKSDYPQYEKILSHWRAGDGVKTKGRAIRLTDPEWPAIIHQLQADGHYVYGLTKIDTGALGSIPSTEEWRFNELSKLGIVFSQNLNDFDGNRQGAALHKGIFFTGAHEKDATLDLFYDDALQPVISSISENPQNLQERHNHIVMIDDMESMVLNVGHWALKYGYAYNGIQFLDIENAQKSINETLLNFQKNWLITHYEWLEDDEAEKRMGDAS